jgi:hypothetical protein
MADPTTELPKVNEDESRAWAKAEDVAIHFNEMIMNFRLKAVGAVTLAAGLVGSVLLGKGEPPPSINLYTFALGIWFIAIVWVAIMLIDLFYYHRLLLGAVDEVLRIEESSGGRLRLSTQIKKRAEEGFGDSFARGAFYLLPLVAMIGAGVVSCTYASRVPHPPAATTDIGSPRK